MDKSIRNRILSKIPYGLYIVASKTKEGPVAIVANWVGQVSFDPPLISVSIEYDSDMNGYIEESKYFSVNMLYAGAAHFAKAFLKKSRPVAASVNGKEITLATNGSPFLKDAIASLECRVENSVRVGDHVMFVGEAIDGILHSDGDILTLKETGWKYNR